jgi:hypothetical protein
MMFRTKGISGARLTQPSKYSGSLDEYEYFNVSLVVRRELSDLQIKGVLHDGGKTRDLTITGLTMHKFSVDFDTESYT